MNTFILGLASAMILLLLGQRIALAYRRRDRKAQLVEEVAKSYLALDKSKVPLGAQGFIAAGAARLTTKADLLAARQAILDHGGHDPLMWVRDALQEFEFLDFLKWQAANGCTPRDYQNKEFFRQYVERFRNQSRG